MTFTKPAPYYQDDWVTIYHGDCRDVLTDLTVSSVDVLLTDPPYGMNWTGLGSKANVSADGVRQGMRTFRAALFAGRHMLRPDAHLYTFCHWESWPDFYDSVATFIPVRNALIWWKDRQTLGNYDAQYVRDFEVILFATSGGRPLSRPGSDGSVISGIPPIPSVTRQHPTEKPVALLRHLLSKSGSADGVLLDPFMGVGSSLIAARDSHMRSIGIEIEERYCEIAAKRCAQEVLELSA